MPCAQKSSDLLHHSCAIAITLTGLCKILVRPHSSKNPNPKFSLSNLKTVKTTIHFHFEKNMLNLKNSLNNGGLSVTADFDAKD